MASERNLVARLLRTVRIRNDDAALLDAKGKLALTTDISFSGSHSPRGTSYYDMGWRSAVSNLSDLAAMGAKPLAFLLSMGLPPVLANKASVKIAEGARDACKAHHTKYAGGDMKRAREITLAGFTLGRVEGKPLLRSNARPGDVVCVSGSIGDAACGFHALSKKKKAAPRLLNAFLKPRALVREAALVSKNAKRAACMDVTDGLLFTCSELARLSKVRIDIESLSIPVSSEAHDFCASNKLTVEKLLNWGEDYALVFSMSTRDFERLYKKAKLVCIGFASKGRGLRLDGRRIRPRGYDAFKNSA